MIQKNWQDLIKPQRLDVQPGRRPDREATIVVEPLERGFGITLGNALRRVLLSSLQGAAITQVQIDGVLHEFSSIAGVREDVTDIVLNLKSLGLRVHSDTAKRMHLKVEGPCIVTAGMIEARPRHRDHGSRPRDLPRRQGRQAGDRDDRAVRQGLCAGLAEQGRGRADRPDRDRRDLQPRAQGGLQGRQCPRRPADRL